MKLHAFARNMRLLALSGAAIYALSLGIGHARNAAIDGQDAVVPNHVLIVDGSESTGGGKPPKPHSRLVGDEARLLIADGSEFTGKPPKPKNG